MGPAVDLRALCEHLKQLGGREPSAATRRELEQALGSKWEGVQVTAARSLAAWGDAKSLDKVSTYLGELCLKPARWSAIGAVAEALVPHAASLGVTWIIELYLDRCRDQNRFSLWPLTDALPYEACAAFLERRLRARRTQPDVAAESLLGRVRVRRLLLVEHLYAHPKRRK
jgi:hypothetical protein